MKKLTILLLFIFFLVLPHIVCAQSAKDALLALKKLNARCEAGISYKDYSPALGEAKFQVNLFLESSEAIEKTDLTTSIVRTMNDFENARLVWNQKFKSYSGVAYTLNPEEARWKKLLETYPAANKPDRDGGAIIELLVGINGEMRSVIFIDLMVDIILEQASTELKSASVLLAKLENKGKSKKKQKR